MACMTDNISTNLSALFRDLPSTLAGFSPLLLFLFAASFAAADDAADTALQLRLIESEDNTIAELATEGQHDAFFNPYDRTQFDALTIQALQRQEAGDHVAALEAFDQAWKITRVANGLLHGSQIPIVQSMIVSEIELEDWESVDNHFGYLEHLYQRLYDNDDPRLELGLQKVSSWHVNAFNANVDGKRRLHLEKARKLFKTRLAVAEQTLPAEDPKFAFLHQSIGLTEQYLFLMSNRNREQLRQSERAARDRLLATLN